jgi:hypothetical protein
MANFCVKKFNKVKGAKLCLLVPFQDAAIPVKLVSLEKLESSKASVRQKGGKSSGAGSQL